MSNDDNVKYIVFKGVYPPAEDTFLLLDYLSKLNVNGIRVLEVGCGCGVISIFLAKKGALVTAVDINDKAIKNTKYNAQINGVKIDVYKSNLLANVKGKYDLIIFNTPYMEVREDPQYSGGTDLILKFLTQSIKSLNSHGRVVFTAYDKNDIGLIITQGLILGLNIKIVMRRRLFFEEIYVLSGYRMPKYQS